MNASAGAVPLLVVRDLAIRFGADDVPATVDGADLTMNRGEIVALVGESGSGKSLIAHTIAGILAPAARLSAARLELGGLDLRQKRVMASLRGREVGIVFQNPRSALNPVRRVGQQIADVIREHRGLAGRKLQEAVFAALRAVGIPEAAARARSYPAELSGGMCQRAMIAIALAGNPALLVADEPTTGLDTTTQAAILALILDHAQARRMATLFITHDLALARAYAQRILVMHAGQIVEEATTAQLFVAPRHPYSAALIGATPASAAAVADLKGIAGAIPSLAGTPPACRFAERCARALPRCRTERPPLERDGAQAALACWNPL